MTARLLLATMVMGLAAAGCVHTGFTSATGIVVPPRSAGCYLDVVFVGPPPYAYAVLGEVTTSSLGPRLFTISDNNVVAIRRMTEEACAVGAHGLMNVVADSQLVGFGKGRWKSTNGGAVAFIQVDAYGRPLPPPNGPRGFIQPYAYPFPVVPAPAVAAPSSVIQ
jgi:hypothetical protein